MAAATAFFCSYCTEEFFAPSEVLLLNHIRIVHSYDPGFSIQCSNNGCLRTFTNFRTYQNHRLQHRSIEVIENNDESDDGYEEDIETVPSLEDDSVQSAIPTDMRTIAAKWILRTGEVRNLTRKATQGVIEDTEHLVDFVTESLKSQVNSVLNTNGINPANISGLKEVFSDTVTKPFDGLSSFHFQKEYYRQHFNLIAS